MTHNYAYSAHYQNYSFSITLSLFLPWMDEQVERTRVRTRKKIISPIWMWALSNYCYYWSCIHNKKASTCCDYFVQVLRRRRRCLRSCFCIGAKVCVCDCVTLLFVCVLDVLYAIHTNTVERQCWVRCIAVDGFLSSFRIGKCVCMCSWLCACAVWQQNSNMALNVKYAHTRALDDWNTCIVDHRTSVCCSVLKIIRNSHTVTNSKVYVGKKKTAKGKKHTTTTTI